MPRKTDNGAADFSRRSDFRIFGSSLLCMRFALLSTLMCAFSAMAMAQYPNILIDDSGDPEEPSIFINPKNTQNLVAGANINFGYRSFDGGSTWQKQSLSSTYGVWGDPCILADTAGNFYFFHLSNPPNGNWIDRIVCQKSTDGGITWNNGSYMGLNGSKAQDKEWAVFDAITQTIYVTWTQFDEYGTSNTNDSSVILFSKSTDFGETWSPAVRINKLAGDCIDSDNTAEGAVPAVGPDGEVYVCWSNRDTLFFDRSTDGGNTWLQDDIMVSLQPGGWDYGIQGISRCNGLPVTRCDLSGGAYHGTIYVNWTDQRNGEDNTDVFISKSTDGGFTWSEPVTVNDDNSNRQQFFSWMDVDQKTGIIYVIFYDRRNHEDKSTDVYVAYSEDGGETFVNEKISEEPFSPKSTIFFGDYTNISAYNGKVAPIWARMDGSSLSVWTAILDFPTSAASGIPVSSGDFLLGQNFPNPFSYHTTIDIRINAPGTYTLTLFDLSGHRLTDIFRDRLLEKGSEKVTLDAKELGLSAGAYYYTVQKENEMVTKKLIVVHE
jgi:hypothetical protein